MTFSPSAFDTASDTARPEIECAESRESPIVNILDWASRAIIWPPLATSKTNKASANAACLFSLGLFIFVICTTIIKNLLPKTVQKMWPHHGTRRKNIRSFNGLHAFLHPVALKRVIWDGVKYRLNIACPRFTLPPV